MLKEVKDTSELAYEPWDYTKSVEKEEGVEEVDEAAKDISLDDNSEKSENAEFAESTADEVEENAKTENDSAAARTSSLLSTAPYSHFTEEELDIEYEQELLPSIEGGIYPDGCV